MSGLYVAWKGRLLIYKHLNDILKRRITFLYCDTDSIKFAHSINLQVPLLFDISPERLGAWKDEGRFNEFCCNKRKKYVLINYKEPEKSKFALSGINGSLKIPDILIKYLKDPKTHNETLNHIRKIFSHEHSVIIKNAKNVRVLAETYDQTVIKTTDFNTNPNLKGEPVAIMEIDPEKMEYRWKWTNGEKN